MRATYFPWEDIEKPTPGTLRVVTRQMVFEMRPSWVDKTMMYQDEVFTGKYFQKGEEVIVTPVVLNFRGIKRHRLQVTRPDGTMVRCDLNSKAVRRMVLHSSQRALKKGEGYGSREPFSQLQISDVPTELCRAYRQLSKREKEEVRSDIEFLLRFRLKN